MRTIEWMDSTNQLKIIDQRALPAEVCYLTMHHPHQVIEAIHEMAVRGAPAIGVTAAFGLALAAVNTDIRDRRQFVHQLEKVAQELLNARPTAVNLSWAVIRILDLIKGSSLDVDKLRQLILDEAKRIADEDVTINHRMAKNGAELIDDGDTIIHHCNTGALAAVEWGTALGVIRKAHEMGKRVRVLVDETRPRLQGARLTAWELQQYGIPHEIIADSAAGYFLQQGLVSKVMFGADRVAANGDIANKIGTYMLALAAHDNQVPVYCVAPTSSIDIYMERGEMIPIEMRPAQEVLSLEIAGVSVYPSGAKALNPAFDITPHRLLSAIITEKGVITPPYGEKMHSLVEKKTMNDLIRCRER